MHSRFIFAVLSIGGAKTCSCKRSRTGNVSKQRLNGPMLFCAKNAFSRTARSDSIVFAKIGIHLKNAPRFCRGLIVMKPVDNSRGPGKIN